MKNLVYTIACGEATKMLQRIMHPLDVLVLDENILKVHPLDRMKVRGARTRIREFIDIEEYDNIICVEPDIEIPSPLLIGDGQHLEIERGYCPMSDLGFGLSEDVWAPWNGFVAIPKSLYCFLDTWAEAYEWFRIHRIDEQVLLEALEDYPFVWRDVIHHRHTSKLNFLPDFFKIQERQFSKKHEHPKN